MSDLQKIVEALEGSTQTRLQRIQMWLFEGATSVLSTVIQALTFRLTWLWFITPWLGMKAPTVLIALGVLMMLRMLKSGVASSTSSVRKEYMKILVTSGLSARWTSVFYHCVYMTVWLSILGESFIIHLFM